jgi:hypothetical protein
MNLGYDFYECLKASPKTRPISDNRRPSHCEIRNVKSRPFGQIESALATSDRRHISITLILGVLVFLSWKYKQMDVRLDLVGL